MAENSRIEWTDHTFNPWIGCSKVSDGCRYCYAESLNNRYSWAVWGTNGTRKRTSDANWKKVLMWNKRAGERGVREKVFCASLADVFEDRPDTNNWLFDLGLLITDTPNLDWLLLTKRPQNVMRLVEDYMGGRMAELWLADHPNVWIGTSVENQEQANRRIPELLRVPAAKRFLSMEPLLGQINISEIRERNGREHLPLVGTSSPEPRIHWVIVGGESGQKARPMHPDWVRSLRDQCVDAEVPFFFKQWGRYLPLDQAEQMRPDDKLWMDSVPGGCQWVGPDHTWADAFAIGKKKAGRMLDGRTWDEVPDSQPREAGGN